MRRIMAIGTTMIMLLAGNLTRAENCGIVNPSFEVDDPINDITKTEPTGWSVDMDSDKFAGEIELDVDPNTDGFYVLTLYTKGVQFHAADMVIVSQAEPVDLSTISWISFYLKLATKADSFQWDPNVCSAVLLIDGDVVWDSNNVCSDVRGEDGEYYPQFYVVERKYRTPDHTLSLGMRMNQSVRFPLEKVYIAHWDMIDCNFCEGLGSVEGDIDGDCFVDMNDVKVMAELWLSDGVDPNDPANLSDVGDDPNSYAIIDFRDFAVYALIWDGDMTVLKDEIAFNWLNDGIDPDYEYNLFGEDDIRPHGEINFFDFAVLGDNWLRCDGSGEE